MVFAPYLVLSIIVFGMNIIPAFMPPTWVVLAFYYIHFKLDLVPLVIIGATFATLGRVVLYRLSRDYLRPLFSKNSQENLSDLKDLVERNQKVTIPLVIAYAFLPIPSNQAFITAGLARINIKIYALSFFFGRLISYTFWVLTTHTVSRSIEGIFGGQINKVAVIAVEVIGFLIVIGISRIKWGRFIKSSKD